ncbi:MAG: type I-E CRISPR-associated protein Cas6/Cse3/CasE, partial [Bacteroidota bacterium]
MYLTKLTLNPRSIQAQQDLAVPYDLHRTLSCAFPDNDSTQHRKRHGVLFRIEDASRAGVPVLVQSTSPPAWERLHVGYALQINGPKPFTPSLAEGQMLRFRLVANPVRRIRVEGKKNPRRMPLVHARAKDGIETGYLDWLERQ